MTEQSSILYIQFSSVMSLCHPMDCSTPGFPVHHQLPELAQAHVHQVGRNYAAQVAIVKEMTGRNRAAQLEIVKQMSRQ